MFTASKMWFEKDCADPLADSSKIGIKNGNILKRRGETINMGPHLAYFPLYYMGQKKLNRVDWQVCVKVKI